MCELVIARMPAAAPGRRVQRGTVLCANDPVVRRSPGLFSVYMVEHHCNAPKSSVEQATAAPGELRNVRLPEVSESRLIREWAAANGYEVSPRGKIPTEVVEAYHNAHAEG